MAAKLVAEEGELKGLVLSLDNGASWTIGRDPDECQLVIQDPLASRKHLIARQTDKGISVENLSLTNPIQVNEEEIGENPRLLQPGDTLKIGNEVFRYYTDDHVHLVDDMNQSTLSQFAELTADPAANRLPTTDLPFPKEDSSFNTSDTIFDDNDTNFDVLADINFGLVETGRWLIKVIGGPNNGAEFYMKTGHSYILGTDPHTCDIVFQDTSVSRQHAKIIVTPEETLLIEDLKSRNKILVNNSTVEERQTLLPNTIVNIGTTSFVVYDREGEMQTIISPLLPSIVKVLQQEEVQVEPLVNEQAIINAPVEPIIEPIKPKRSFGSLIFTFVILSLMALAGFGTFSLFKSEPIVSQIQENAIEQINQALSPFSAIRYSYNKSTGGLLLLGHVSNANDKNQLLYNLQTLKFIKPNAVDDSGIVIDEYVWQEFNSILNRSNPAWRSITVHSPIAGQFILSGYLETKRQAEQLNDYISLNFPYLDLLKKQVIVEEDILNQIKIWFQYYNLRNVAAKMTSGEVILTGTVSADLAAQLEEVIGKIKTIPGVRVVNNLIKPETVESGIINISNQYEVTGQSRLGSRYTVVINGRILSQGDSLDGMLITQVTPLVILLEKDNVKYRIDYNH